MSRRTLAIGSALLVFAAAGGLALWRTAREPRPAELEARVRAECSRCHAFAPPEVLPREAWRKQIEQMAFLSGYVPPAGGAAELDVDEIVAWYEARAPERLAFEPAQTRDAPGPLRFERRGVLLGEDGGPGVATVSAVDPGILPALAPRLAAPNMSNGSLHLFSLAHGPLRIGAAGHPARVASGDFDRDGRIDLLVADLGDPMPSDEPVGRVLVARNLGGGRFELVPILEGVGRVADAQPVDLDADGDLDVVAGSFGWLRRGGVSVLRNQTPPGGALVFASEPVSAQAGVVSVVPLADSGVSPRSGDTRPRPGPGFAAAVAQQLEQVSIFMPAPEGFAERVVWRAPHPNWGTTNLSAADLDADGDPDLLLANGDTLDDGVAFKPWHGVSWLENRGALGVPTVDPGEFREHRIGALYGAQAAVAADLDADGDLDVVACSFLPQVELPVGAGRARVDSVVWFERRGEEWIPWAIESNHPRHTGCTVVDLDGDGRLDVAAAINRAWDATAVETGPGLEVWLNAGPGAD